MNQKNRKFMPITKIQIRQRLIKRIVQKNIKKYNMGFVLKNNSQMQADQLQILVTNTILSIKYNQTDMIQEDPARLQTTVSSDFDTIFKLIKTLEENYLILNDIITKVIHSRSEIQENMFIHDQIRQYKQIIGENKSKQKRFIEQKQQLMTNHPRKIPSNERINMFLKRVCFRILEVIFISINQTTYMAATIYQRFLRLKIFCQKIIQENNQDKSFQLIKQITDFTVNKFTCLVNCLQSITEKLQNGNIDEIDKLKDSQISKKNSLASNEPLSCKENMINLDANQVKTRVIDKKALNKEETRQFDRVGAHKKARRAMDGIKDVIDFNRQDYIQDFISTCQQNKQKMVKQLLGRNQVNKKQIFQFIQKKANRRKRKLSNDLNKQPNPQHNQEKMSNSHVKSNQSSCQTTRKSLLLKFKDQQYRQRAITSQFYRKTSQGSQMKFKIRSNQKTKTIDNQALKENKNAIIRAIQEIICQNEELEFKLIEKGSQHLQKLPPLNKRANSVDQHYPKDQNQQSRCIAPKKLSSSIKQSTSLIKKSRLDKSDVFPSKFKKSNNFLYQQLNNKLIHISDLNKQIKF